MRRYLLAILTLFLLSAPAKSAHITGGEMFYTYLGQSGGNYQYHVTVKLFRDCYCSNCATLDLAIGMAVFDRGNGSMVWSNGSVQRTNVVTLSLTSPSPCINNPPTVCYEVGYYETDISLPATPNGYIVVFQRCCRIPGINNLINSNGVGATYTAEIPGTNPLATAPVNNSARFVGADTVVVCANNPFTYSFAAQDADGDQLSYSFCTAYLGGGQAANPPNGPNTPTPFPPANPPYIPVPYATPPFDATSPLGPGVTINSITGLITGIAPAAGIYVVTVCVTETRNGVVIATQRKDLQIKVGDCDLATPVLNPRATTCDGFTLNFQNDDPSPSPLINSYFWDFGVPTLTNDTSNLANPTYTYPDTGVFVVKLVTNRYQQCSDSATTVVRIFPGFFPGFIVAGSCYTNPFQFTDTTLTNYGFVDSWSWDFGDPTTLADTSHLQNPTWTYPTPGPKTVRLIVSNSKGCIDTVFMNLNVLDKPPITLAFRDTLICIPASVTLNAGGTGIFNWTPPISIINANTGTPTVNPTTSTWYIVNLNDNGCLNKDSVHVRVTSGVNLIARPDTTICLGDAVQLSAATNGLTFNWTPAATLNNPNVINPIATPTAASTTYQLQAWVGSCTAVDDVTVFAVPYPVANAGPDQIICYNGFAQLNGSHDGNQFTWSPTSYLDNPVILNPRSYPPRTTTYVLTVYDNGGCPKPGRDTVVITVLPKVRAYAGRDTSVVINQPLQLNASGGASYLWIPSTFLNNNTIQNPVAIFPNPLDSFTYKLVAYNIAGCTDTASITVRVFAVSPTVFVPTAFTPNGDGLNDVVRPIAVGIRRIIYFSIYNRWGQRVFITTEDKKGWDGRINGVLQSSNVFVWMVQAEDYLGNKIFLKGTVALIR
ncbi:MAG: gliding motility-associated C-terminal domain-containing protein [Sphingobacteriales bacterium]|nr:gliding motility-associated C-terminal domain-containing protein [Sphingobacteriales bacterium]